MNVLSKHETEALARHVAEGAGAPGAGMRTQTALIAAGAALAATALVVQRRSQDVERTHPPIGKFIEVDGVRLHYTERGDGQPLVMLHGVGAMMQDLIISGIVDMAASKYRVILFDRPGYGYSERPRTTIWTPHAQARLLHKALQQMGIAQPIVFAHSWAGMVATAMALDFPDDVKSLVLLSGYYYPTARLDIPYMAAPSIPLVGDLMRYTISPLLGRAIWPAMKRKLFAPAPVPRRFEQEFPTWMTLRPSQLRASAAEYALLIPAAYAMQARYHELLLPVVIMAGDGDRHVDTRLHSERLHHELPHSSFLVAHGAGHMVHHCAQDQVMAAIDEAATAVGAVPVEHQRAQAGQSYVFPSPGQVS
ncbi:MAG TPA: alpha/beta hydrolase [Noviherbaspirillum sp.]|nr:alpha/beta hydrolase [Noviherbaspirillum sp.]